MSRLCKKNREIIKAAAIKFGMFFVRDLSVATNLPPSTIVHHLNKINEDGDLYLKIEYKKLGSNYPRYYTVADNPIAKQAKDLWRIALFGKMA